jgi:hypothetical protein
VIDWRKSGAVRVELAAQPRHHVDDPHASAGLGLTDVDPTPFNVDVALVELAQLADPKPGKSESRDDRAPGSSASATLDVAAIEVEGGADRDAGTGDHLLLGHVFLVA